MHARSILVALLSLPLLLGALVPAVPVAGASGDWPQFRGGPAHLGYNPDESILSPVSIRQLQPAWTATTGDRVYSSPAVADGVVYVGSLDGNLYAFAVGCNTGGGSCTPIWTGTTGGGIDSSPAVADGVVYVGSSDGDLYAYAVGCNSGGGSCSPLWTGATGSDIDSSPAVADGVVYVGSEDGKLYAFAVGCASGGETCTPRWTGATGDGIFSSPAVADGVVYVGSFDGKLYAFAVGCNSGGGSCEPVWTAAASLHIYSSPAVADGVVYVGAYDGKLYAFMVGCNSGGGSCTPIWTGQTGSDEITSSPAVANGVVYIGSYDGKLYAFAVGCNIGGRSCTPIWTGATSPGIFLSSPAVSDGVVYVGAHDGTLRAFDYEGPPDFTPPVASLGLNGDALSSTAADITATIHATDDSSGVRAYRLSNDGTTWSDWTKWPVGAASADAPWTLSSSDGANTVYAEVRDAAENVSLPASAAIDLDTTAFSPFYAVSINSDATFTDSPDVLLDLLGPAGTSGMEISNQTSFHGATWEPYAAHRAWTLSDPQGQVVTEIVYARFRTDPNDLVGTLALGNIVVDPLPPTAGTATVSGSAKPGSVGIESLKTFTLNTTASDQVGGSGVAAMELSTSSSFAGAVWQPYASSIKWPYDTRAKVTVYDRFMDGAGNVSKTYKKVLSKPATASVVTAVAPAPGTTAPSRHPAFSWLALTGAKKYQLEVSTGGTFATTLLNTTTTKLSVIPSSSLPTGTLYWRVRKSGGSWSPVWSFTVPISDPPTLSSPAAGATLGTLSPDLTWGAIAGASSYQVELGPDASFLSGVQTFSASGTHQQLAPLARQAAYWWRVRAKLGSTYGPWSTGRSFITPAIDTVSLLTPAGGATLSSLPALLDWADVTGATSYHLQVCSNSSCTTTVRDTSVTNSLYQLTTPLTNGTYWWRVEAVSASATGAWSSVRSFVK